jgi:peptidyl-prolyl cis-trans isomerase D
MFRFFHRKDKLVKYFMGGLLVLVCITMVGYLIPGFTGSSQSEESVVVRVGSERITSTDLAQQFGLLIRNSRLPASMIPFYAPTILNQMIMERATLMEARRLGLTVTQNEVAAMLRSNPVLFPGGQFVGYDQYRQVIEIRYGMSVAQFEEQFQRSLLDEKLRRLVTAGVVLTDQDVLREYRRRNDKVKVDYVLLKTTEVRDKIQVSDAELNTYFQKNRNRYDVPEQRQFRVVFADSSKARDNVQVTDQDLRNYYSENRDRFRVEDRVKAAHILFKTVGKTPAEAEEVKKKAQDVLQKLQKGADFAPMAKQYSDDAASTAKGGDLGWLVRGQQSLEAEKVSFSLEPGKLSGVVQTPIGFEIIKVEERQRAHQQSLDEVRDQILPLAKAAKAQRLTEEESRRIDDAVRKNRGNLQALAAQLGIPLTETGLLKRGDPLPVAGSAPSADDTLFASNLKPNQVTDPVQLPNGVLLAQLVKIVPAHPAELAEVRDRAENDFRNQKAAETVQARMKQLAQMARQNGLQKAAAASGLKVQTSELFTADGSIKDVGSASSLSDVFRLKVGEIGGPNSVTDGQVVYRVAERQDADETKLDAATKESLRSELRELKAYDVYQVFVENLRNRLEKEGKLRVNQAALDRLTSVYQ